MKRGVRWFGLGVGVLAGLLLLVVGGLYLTGMGRINQVYEVSTADLVIPADSAAIERGAHLARIHGCTDCHTPNLGGAVFVDEPPFRVVAANLTRGRGGIGSAYTAEDFDRAMRHGVRPDGRSLFIMPSAAYHNLSDEDAAHIIAYLQSVPAVDNELPATEVRLLGRVLSAVAIDPSSEVRTTPARAEAPAPTASPEYGAYLTSITCAYCHGSDLRGAQPPTPGSPLAPDLAAAGQWSFGDFDRAMRTGVTPDGRQLDPDFMPWGITANMTEEELVAIQAHLATVMASGGSQ